MGERECSTEPLEVDVTRPNIVMAGHYNPADLCHHLVWLLLCELHDRRTRLLGIQVREIQYEPLIFTRNTCMRRVKI